MSKSFILFFQNLRISSCNLRCLCTYFLLRFSTFSCWTARDTWPRWGCWVVSRRFSFLLGFLRSSIHWGTCWPELCTTWAMLNQKHHLSIFCQHPNTQHGNSLMKEAFSNQGLKYHHHNPYNKQIVKLKTLDKMKPLRYCCYLEEKKDDMQGR